jgi:START domain
VKSRDFVNLRCWKFIRNGRVVDDYKLDTEVTATIKEENEAMKGNGDNEEAGVTNDEEVFSDAQAEASNDSDKTCFMSAAMSIDYPLYPPTTKYIRGDNIISCWAMKPIPNEEACTFEWLLCIDLKGSLPKYVLNTAFLSLMVDYMLHLRAHIKQLKKDQEVNCA